jgi:hypothetical protein
MSSFYGWLLANHPANAEAFRSFGLPTNTNRLYVLLRACKYRTQMNRVRRWHRWWRTHRKSEGLERAGQIKRIEITDFEVTSFPDDGFIHGIKRSVEITFELNFDDPGRFGQMMDLFYYQNEPERWQRVVRRWEAKHR